MAGVDRLIPDSKFAGGGKPLPSARTPRQPCFSTYSLAASLIIAAMNGAIIATE